MAHIIHLSIAVVFGVVPVEACFQTVFQFAYIQPEQSLGFEPGIEGLAVTQIVGHIFSIDGSGLALSFLPSRGHNAVALRGHEAFLAQTVQLLRHRSVDFHLTEQPVPALERPTVGEDHTIIVGTVFVNAAVVKVRVGLAVIERARIIKSRLPLPFRRLRRRLPESIAQRGVYPLIVFKIVGRIYLRIQIAEVHIEHMRVPCSDGNTLAQRKQLAVAIGLETCRKRHLPAYLLDVHDATGKIAILYRRYSPNHFHTLDIVSADCPHVHSLVRNVAIILRSASRGDALGVRERRKLQVGIGIDRRPVYDKLRAKRGYGKVIVTV